MKFTFSYFDKDLGNVRPDAEYEGTDMKTVRDYAAMLSNGLVVYFTIRAADKMEIHRGYCDGNNCQCKSPCQNQKYTFGYKDFGI